MAWTPGQSDLVCFCHFVDGIPTLLNSDPTLKLGYEETAKKTRQELIRIAPLEARKTPENPTEVEVDSSNFEEHLQNEVQP